MARSAVTIAKITAPGTSEVLHRDRLYRMLDECGKTPVTWTTGPPGSGKTTLIAGYLDRRSLPRLWYRFDDGDADPATFFSYLGQAVKQAAPRSRRPLPLLTPEYAFGVPAFTRRYFEQVYQRCRPPVVLVFDNYQDVPRESPVQDVMQEAFSAAPPGTRIFVISRDAPPPAFSRLLAGGGITVLGWEDLRFDRTEAETLITTRMRTRLPDETLQLLYEKNDGWAAGLVLSILSMKRLALDIETLRAVPSEDVFTYFAHEVFAKADGETRDALRKTAFLPDMTFPMVSRLTGTDRAGQILTEMSRRHYFTFRHGPDDGEPAYQYHPLFRDFLLSQAEAYFDHDDLHGIRRKAAGLLNDAGRIEHAADLYRANEDSEELAGMVTAHAQKLLAQGRHRTLLTWLSWIPERIMRSNARLLFWSAMARLTDDPAAARALAEKAYELYRARNDTAGMLMSSYPAVGATCYESADFRPLDRWVRILEPLLRGARRRAPPHIETRALNSMFVSLLLRRPDHPEIILYRDRLLAAAQQVDDADQRIQLTADVALHPLWTGDHARAVELINSLLDLARRRSMSVSPLAVTTLRTYEAMCYAFTGMPDACRHAAAKGLETAHASGIMGMAGQLTAHAAAGALCAGELQAAAALLEELENVLPQAQRVAVGYSHLIRSWLALLRGERDAAFEHARRSIGAAREIGGPFLEAVAAFGIAQVHISRGELKDAKEHLAAARRTGRAMKSRILEFMCLLSSGQIALAEERMKDALAHLRSGLRLGRREGYTFHLFWQPDVMGRICAAALDAGIEVGYVQDLIRRRALPPPDAASAPDAWPWFLKVQTLGTFEILREGKPLRFPGKAQQKPLALLKALVAQGGREVGVDQLMYALWPESEGDQAHKSCEVTLHRLRKLLGEDRAVRLHEGRLSLDPTWCRVDAWAFEKIIQEAEHFEQRGRPGGESGKRTGGSSAPWRRDLRAVIHMLDRVLSLYRGPFLPADAGLSWTVSYREGLRSKFIRLVLGLGTSLERCGRYEDALECYQKGLDVDCLAEEFYQHLMLCYDRLGQQMEARDAYRRCRSVLSATLGLPPSARSEEIYRSVTSRNAASH